MCEWSLKNCIRLLFNADLSTVCIRFTDKNKSNKVKFKSVIIKMS